MKSERQKKIEYYANAKKRRSRYRKIAITISAIVVTIPVILSHY